MVDKGRKRFGTVMRRALVADWRVQGKTAPEIVKLLWETKNVKAKALTIRNDFIAIMKQYQEHTHEAVAQYRMLQLERTEMAIKAIFPRVVLGELEAIHATIRVMERQAKLMGLDAPAKVDIEQNIRIMAQKHGFNEEEAVRAAEGIHHERRKLLNPG